MGVPCSGCGREYDVALFEFGRTLHCRCGRRVGLEARVRTWPGDGEPRFLADAMLGRLASWLRILGFDCAYEADVPDEHLVRRAIQEGRVILTRDRALPDEWRVEGVRLMHNEEPLEQLREIVEAFALARRLRLFTRCSRCNTPLAEVSAEEVRERVPPRLLSEPRVFRRCPGCERVYWEGSHTERMRGVVEDLLAELR